MKELKYLSDRELADRIVGYIERLDELDCMLSAARKDKNLLRGSCEMQLIQCRYSQLKEDLHSDVKYLATGKSERHDSNAELYNAFFRPSICEATAYGLNAPVNSHNLSLMVDAVSEAKYRITKYHSLSIWKSIMDPE